MRMGTKECARRARRPRTRSETDRLGIDRRTARPQTNGLEQMPRIVGYNDRRFSGALPSISPLHERDERRKNLAPLRREQVARA
jgi:hypothetical protein